jgi:hypothetical protein
MIKEKIYILFIFFLLFSSHKLASQATLVHRKLSVKCLFGNSMSSKPQYKTYLGSFNYFMSYSFINEDSTLKENKRLHFIALVNFNRSFYDFEMDLTYKIYYPFVASPTYVASNRYSLGFGFNYTFWNKDKHAILLDGGLAVTISKNYNPYPSEFRTLEVGSIYEHNDHLNLLTNIQYRYELNKKFDFIVSLLSAYSVYLPYKEKNYSQNHTKFSFIPSLGFIYNIHSKRLIMM